MTLNRSTRHHHSQVVDYGLLGGCYLRCTAERDEEPFRTTLDRLECVANLSAPTRAASRVPLGVKEVFDPHH